MSQLFGGLEAGGTKFNCAIGTGPKDIITHRIPTTTPAETIGRVIEFFKEQPTVTAIGIGTFGPIDPDRASPTYGYITTTPKPGWQFTNLAGEIKKALQIPVSFDTDVNAAALGEYRWGVARSLADFIYLTVGTGIGGGGMVNGKLMHGMVHPEMGHMRIPHDWVTDPYKGCCPYHGDCFEGLASGTAVAQRWGQWGETLQPDHPAWILEARYLALAVSNLILTLSPRRVILGGGVMEQAHLFPIVRKNVVEILHSYIQATAITRDIASYIVPPGLGKQAGLLGALALGKEEGNPSL
jgi:fructokinase